MNSISGNICKEVVSYEDPIDAHMILCSNGLYSIFSFIYYENSTYIRTFRVAHTLNDEISEFIDNIHNRNYLIMNCKSENSDLRHLINIALEGKLKKSDEIHNKLIHDWITWRLERIGDAIRRD